MNKIILKGHYDPTVYSWNNQSHSSFTNGAINVPMKATITQKDGHLSFNIWDYRPIDKGDNSKDHLIKYIGKFKCNDQPIASSNKDNSGGEWKTLTWVGQYISFAQKTCELRISQAQYGKKLVDIYVRWPHKQDRWDSKGFHSYMILLYLDEKSQKIFDNM